MHLMDVIKLHQYTTIAFENKYKIKYYNEK